MRDRLNELLRGEISSGGYNFKLTDRCGDIAMETLVDYLLENGVIVPPIPVKIGDKIYRIMCRGFGDFFIREETVWIVDNHAFAGFEIITKYVSKGCCYFPKIEKDNIGETVFLTKEQAEKALAEVNDK